MSGIKVMNGAVVCTNEHGRVGIGQFHLDQTEVVMLQEFFQEVVDSGGKTKNGLIAVKVGQKMEVSAFRAMEIMLEAMKTARKQVQ